MAERSPKSDSAAANALDPVDVLHLPIGVYVLDADGGFVSCNDGVRQILALGAGERAPARLAELCVEPARFGELCAAALDAEREGNGFQKAVVALRIGDRDVFIENYLKPLRAPESQELRGFVGCMADITDEHRSAAQTQQLQRQIEELTFDIGRILHANTSTLLMVAQTLDSAVGALGLAGPMDHSAVPDANSDPDELLSPLAEELARNLDALLEIRDPDRRSKALPEEDWLRLEGQTEILGRILSEVPVAEMRAAAWRRCAMGIGETCRRIEGGALPRERVRALRSSANELVRRACLAELAKTQAAVIQMDLTLRALRDFITSDVRSPESKRRVPLESMVQEAIGQLADFARASNVEINWQRRGAETYVRANERDLLRSVCNLLHNAVKYSWQRDRGTSPWVAIRTSEHEEPESRAMIEFESWGVPITPKEIEEALIFQIGYRGKWSKDRGRLGTGIGLTDARQVARAHGGDVEVMSRPAHATPLGPEDREYFERPFLTRVTLWLPIA